MSLPHSPDIMEYITTIKTSVISGYYKPAYTMAYTKTKHQVADVWVVQINKMDLIL